MSIEIHFGHKPSPDRDPTEDLFKMPGGEWHIKSSMVFSDATTWAYVRGASADDLVALSIWADAVHRDGGHPRAVIPYLPGARQDRRRPGEALSCKVYADLINRCNLEKVVCLDPHSDVMPALIENLVVYPVAEILSHGIFMSELAAILAPDAGAAKRAFDAAQALKVPLYQATKHRDMNTGKLSSFSCPDLPADGDILVVDDICDGGGTFMGLAKATMLPKSRLRLWVTHGIFSKGSEDLCNYYSTVYTTDSHPGALAFANFHKHPRTRKMDVQVIPAFNFLSTL